MLTLVNETKGLWEFFCTMHVVFKFEIFERKNKKKKLLEIRLGPDCRRPPCIREGKATASLGNKSPFVQTRKSTLSSWLDCHLLENCHKEPKPTMLPHVNGAPWKCARQSLDDMSLERDGRGAGDALELRDGLDHGALSQSKEKAVGFTSDEMWSH